MLKRALNLIAAVAVGCIIFVLPSRANDTGLSALHTKVRIGNRLCYTSHLHHGSGTGTSKRAAIRQAIKTWSSFTVWEYGSDWGRFSRAAGKSADCTVSGSRGWRCNVKARACRSYKGLRPRHRARTARLRRR